MHKVTDIQHKYFP